MEETFDPASGREQPQNRQELLRRAALLAKWVTVLFWLIIPTLISDLMTNGTVVARIPALYLPGELLSIATITAYAVILMRLEDLDRHYKSAGFCILLTAVLSAAMVFLSTTVNDSLMLVLLIPSTLLDLAAMFHEYTAHSAAMRGISDDLSRKWKKLWTWSLATLGAVIVGILLMPFSGILGMLASLAGSVGMLVLSVLKLCYLHQSAGACREFAA